tara:strand:+ start:942 stop:1280 length:339 start_codon:yes stop_codon:yes gene_type:complete
LLVIVVVIVHDEEEEEERRKIFIHASSGGGIATSFARPRRLTHERSTSTNTFSLSLPKFYSCVRVLFFDAKTCHFVSSLRRYRAIVFIINGIVAHDAREEERYTKYFYNNNG